MGVKIDPDLEAFFVAVALMHGTNPKPLFGVERAVLADSLVDYIMEHPGQPAAMARVRRNYAELGGKLLDTDPRWFFTKMADAYLDWLYEQPASQALYDPKDFERHIDELPYKPYTRREWKI